MSTSQNPYCLRCGKRLLWSGRQKRRKYCSFKCSNAHHSFSEMAQKNTGPRVLGPDCGNRRKRSKTEIERLRQIGHIGGVKSAKNQPRRSKGENLLAILLSRSGFIIEQGVWSIVPGYEIDILIPQLNIAISYNGPVHRLPIYGAQRLKQVRVRDTYRDAKLKELGLKHIVVNDEGRFSEKKVFAQYLYCLEHIKK